MESDDILHALAAALAAGDGSRQEMMDRCARLLGRPWRWLGPLSDRFLAQYAGRTRPRHCDAIQFLRQDRGFQQVWRRPSLRLEHSISEPAKMHAAAGVPWDVPALVSSGELAEWLGLTAGELEWFADYRGLAAKARAGEALRHYRYRWLPKRTGGERLLETPKPRLKALQRRILDGILNRMEPHPAAHGFRRGHSIRTFAAPHAGQSTVLRIDLSDFFASVRVARVEALFRTAGYPEGVARLLACLCTNAAPPSLTHGIYSQRHLPQGAPTSPALANLCAYRLDCRLAGRASAVGVHYTRYADDLAFSGGGELTRESKWFASCVAAIATEEGFVVNHHKTRLMRRGVRQQLAGLVANEHPNLRRDDFDRLKAILYNSARDGPESQNREGHANFRAHLEGRVAFAAMINPEKARRLRALLEAIPWP
jgi:hypothetical protein